MPAAPTEVALAVIVRDHAVLLQRRDRAPFSGRWELPGGKVAPGETPDAAAAREAREELGVEVRVGRSLGVHEHRYDPGPWVRLHAFEVAPLAPVPEAPGRAWAPLAALDGWDVLDGTRPVLARLRGAP